MTANTTETTEICTMRIAFPVVDDDQAIAIKKKIAEVLEDVPDAAVTFTLQPARPAMTMPSRG